MENINIKVILDEVFGKSCNNIACETCKYKEDIIKLVTQDEFELDCISNAIICEDDSIISLADDGGIELRNYDIAIIRFNF